jgi:hypothetical protein
MHPCAVSIAVSFYRHDPHVCGFHMTMHSCVVSKCPPLYDVQLLGAHKAGLQSLYDAHSGSGDGSSEGMTIVDAVSLLVVRGMAVCPPSPYPPGPLSPAAPSHACRVTFSLPLPTSY